MKPPMDSTTWTLNPPSPISSPSPTTSPRSARGRAARLQALSPEAPVKPRLVPNGGDAARLGATITAEGVNFAVYSETASAIWVCIFDDMGNETGRFELDGHDDNVHHGLVAGLGAGTKYGLRADGPYDPDQGY